MGKLTQGQRDKYLKSPNHCPFCKSSHISAGEINIDDLTATQKVECEKCEEEWFDTYKLEGVQTQEELDEIVSKMLKEK